MSLEAISFERTFHMGLCALPLGFWYSHWFSKLDRLTKNAFSIALVDTFTLPMIHFLFLVPYHIIHEKKVLNHNLTHEELGKEVKSLWTVDWLIYFPLQILNFSLVKSTVFRVVNVNLIDLIIDIFASMIINDDFDPLEELQNIFN